MPTLLLRLEVPMLFSITCYFPKTLVRQRNTQSSSKPLVSSSKVTSPITNENSTLGIPITTDKEKKKLTHPGPLAVEHSFSGSTCSSFGGWPLNEPRQGCGQVGSTRELLALVSLGSHPLHQVLLVSSGCNRRVPYTHQTLILQKIHLFPSNLYN